MRTVGFVSLLHGLNRDFRVNFGKTTKKKPSCSRAGPHFNYAIGSSNASSETPRRAAETISPRCRTFFVFRTSPSTCLPTARSAGEPRAVSAKRRVYFFTVRAPATSGWWWWRWEGGGVPRESSSTALLSRGGETRAAFVAAPGLAAPLSPSPTLPGPPPFPHPNASTFTNTYTAVHRRTPPPRPQHASF